MKYYKNKNNEIYADPINLEGLVEIEDPIFNNVVLKNHKNIHLVETKEDGSYFNYYKEENGSQVVDIIKEQEQDDLVDAVKAMKIKEKALSSLTVTTVGGKVFYADSDSRIDLSDAISLAEETSQNSTLWKLAEEFEGNRIISVTLDELKEARKLALEAKASLIGI